MTTMQCAADGGGPDTGPAAARLGPVSDADTAAPTVTFDEFYAAQFPRLIGQLYAYTGDMAQAQDVVQEAFARALPRWEKLRDYDDPTAWVRRVAWNLATSRWRQLRTFHAFARRHREEHVSGPTPERVALGAALAKLPPNQRRAVVLHYLSDMSVADIAAQEGVADGTVKSWLHRGRAALAAALTDPRAEVRNA